MKPPITSKVVGVRYAPGEGAPVVLLKGAGEEAASLLEAASLHETPVVRDPALVDALYRLPTESKITRELFPVMAALIAHVMQIKDAAKDT
jgi:flagellar biosynthetic protein FlhB